MNTLTIPPRNQVPHSDEYGGAPREMPSAPQEQKPQQDSFIVEVFKFAILALIIVVPFRLFIAQPFIVNGASMDPTFKTNQYLIVDQLSYHFEQPERGDVVVFRYPNDPSKFFIKRIIGLPGEVVELANGSTTIIDPTTNERTLLEEPYLKTDRTDDHLSITLSSDEYFVMGDNRSASSDSRVWGPVPRKNIVGKTFLRLLPLQQLGLYPGAYSYSNPAEISSGE